MQFLRDPIWQFVGAALALIAIAISIVVSAIQRKRKALSYEILIDSTMLSVREELQSKLRITYERKRVKNLRLLELKFANAGNIPIATADYESPITVHFLPRVTILSIDVSRSRPDNLGATVTNNKDSFRLSPVLLNPADFVVVKLLLNDYEGSFKIDSRIIGVSSVSPVSERFLLGILFILLGFGISMLSIAFVAVSSRDPFTSPPAWQIASAVVGYLAGLMLASYGVARSRTARRNLRKLIRLIQSRVRTNM